MLRDHESKIVVDNARTTALRGVELFCGIGGFRVATDRLRIQTVWANDISPKACKVYRNRFGADELQEGDLQELIDGVPSHDFLSGGFPCQPFSSAGKKEGIRDPRGTLFQLIIDVIERKKPRIFVLENVKRLLTMESGHHFATILASLSALNYRLEWRLINAMDLELPQNRQRVFIVGFRDDADSGRRRIRLANGWELSKGTREQIGTLANPRVWKKIDRHGKRFPDWGMAEQGKFFGWDIEEFGDAGPEVILKSILQNEVSHDFDFTEATNGWIAKNTPVNRFVQGVEILSNQGGGARMGYTIFGIDGVAPTLTSTASRHYERYRIGERYRRLTNIEYARIQGFADDHCTAVSVYDQYALFGNAVPPPMARWVVTKTLGEGLLLSELKSKDTQGGIFDYAGITDDGADEEYSP